MDPKTHDQGERAEESQRLIDEAKDIARDLREETPDPFPESEPPPESPGS
jgi:hypothetical protein